MSFKYIRALLILPVLYACSTVQKPDLDSTGQFSLKGIPSRPGSVAWSSDSKNLAVIKDGSLHIIDTVSGNNEEVKGVKPIFLDWSPGRQLLVVSKKGDSTQILKLDLRDKKRTFMDMKNPPSSVRWLYPPEEMVVLSTEKVTMQIGTFMTYKLSMITKGEEREFFSTEVYFPVLKRDIDLISGWTHPRVRPLHESVLTPVFHKPPVIAPYINLRTVDPVTSLKSPAIRINGMRYNLPASWSPDGSRLAFTNDKGFLRIIDYDAPVLRNPVSYDVQGIAPAWNPMGSQVYVGGWVINADGTGPMQLLPDAFNSYAVWSPNGRKIAIISGNNILHVKQFAPSFILPDRQVNSFITIIHDKLRILKELYVSNLITTDEFNKKKAEILDNREGATNE